MKIHPDAEYCDLPNGCGLYWVRNEVGGRTYYSDECGIASHVWDTSTTCESTIIAALAKEHEIRYKERHLNERDAKQNT